LLRDRRTVPYRLFLDRDDIPNEIIQAVNNHENVSHELLFAPLPPELNIENNRPLPAIPVGEEPDEQETSDSCSVSSSASTISINLDDHTAGISPGLLRAWESNAGIRQQVQSSPRRPDSPFSEYSGPSYSPVRPEESDFNPIDLTPAEEDLADQAANHFLDFLNSEEFLGTIDDVYNT